VGGRRECSRWLEKLEWNGKNRPPRVERKAQDAWDRGIGETLKRPRSQKKRKKQEKNAKKRRTTSVLARCVKSRREPKQHRVLITPIMSTCIPNRAVTLS
jgi:hypothetical protein